MVLAQEVWIENNLIEGGGRIKAGGIGEKIIIKDNIVKNPNDNGITIAIPHTGPHVISTQYIIKNNFVEKALGSAIYIGDDGKKETDPNRTGDNIFKSIIIEGNTLIGPGTKLMIYISLASETKRIHIVNNIIESRDLTGQEFTNGILVKINESDIGREGSDFLIANNTISGKFDHGSIWINQLNNARIVNNQLTSSGARGLRLHKVTDAVISGNIIDNCGLGIFVSRNATGLLFEHNIIKNNSHEGIWLNTESSDDRIQAQFVNNQISNTATKLPLMEKGPGVFDTRYFMNSFFNNSMGPNPDPNDKGRDNLIS
ncbi:MAG: right-handed parallel beta-helix repeat-containing protein [Bacteroidia bacterium]